jgi:hypothetical protein
VSDSLIITGSRNLKQRVGSFPVPNFNLIFAVTTSWTAFNSQITVIVDSIHENSKKLHVGLSNNSDVDVHDFPRGVKGFASFPKRCSGNHVSIVSFRRRNFVHSPRTSNVAAVVNISTTFRNHTETQSIALFCATAGRKGQLNKTKIKCKQEHTVLEN